MLYKKIENSVVNSFEKVSDSFVEKHLTRENESIEEAKERLKKENEQRKLNNEKYVGGKK